MDHSSQCGIPEAYACLTLDLERRVTGDNYRMKKSKVLFVDNSLETQELFMSLLGIGRC